MRNNIYRWSAPPCVRGYHKAFKWIPPHVRYILITHNTIDTICTFHWFSAWCLLLHLSRNPYCLWYGYVQVHHIAAFLHYSYSYEFYDAQSNPAICEHHVSQDKRTAFRWCEFYDDILSCSCIWTTFHNEDRRMAFSPVWKFRCAFKSQFRLKLFVTNRTDEWLFAGVNSTMHY